MSDYMWHDWYKRGKAEARSENFKLKLENKALKTHLGKLMRYLEEYNHNEGSFSLAMEIERINQLLEEYK
jgi:regulator of replication initiation timing